MTITKQDINAVLTRLTEALRSSKYVLMSGGRPMNMIGDEAQRTYSPENVKRAT